MKKTDIKKKLTGWSEKLSVPVDTLGKDYMVFYNQRKKDFPDKDDDIICKKAFQALKGKYKSKLVSVGGASVSSYVMYVIAYSHKKYMMGNVFNNQLNKYNELKNAGREEDAFNDKIVKLDSNNNVVPCYPYKTKRGDVSKRFGDALPTEENGTERMLYGFMRKKDDNTIKGGILKLIGLESCNIVDTMKLGSVYEIDAVVAYTKDDLHVYNVRTNKLQLNEVTDLSEEPLMKYAKSDEISKLVEEKFESFILTVKDLADCRASGKIEWKNGNLLTVIKDAVVSDMNLEENDKDNITFIIDSADSDIDEETVFNCTAKSHVKKIIDFATGSVGCAMCSPWIMENDGNDEDKYSMPISLHGIYAYEDDKIPRREVKPLSESHVGSSSIPEEKQDEMKSDEVKKIVDDNVGDEGNASKLPW